MQKGRKRYIKLLFLLVSAILMTVGIVGYLTYNKPHRKVENTQAEFALSVSEIMNEFQANNQKASEKYIDKVIIVKGIVQSVSIGENTANIFLADDGDFFGVNCSFTGAYALAARAVVKGDFVSIKGECKGFIDDVIMNNCIMTGE